MAKKEPLGLFVDVGGIPVDLNAGLIEAVTNPPGGFVSNHLFAASDVPARVRAIAWFSSCGQRQNIELSMQVQPVQGWQEAMDSCKDPGWENVQLEAQNDLSGFLHNHHKEIFQRWNDLVDHHKLESITPLVAQSIEPFRAKHDLEIAFVQSVEWDILGALMANSYLPCGHSAFFFLELLLVYEAGHFPCGWRGDWPNGKLVIY